MSITHRISIRASSSGLAGGAGVDVSWVLTDGIFERKLIDLSTGFNAITVPADAQVAIFIPPSANAETLILKGVTGDTGIPLSPTEPFLIALDGSGDDIGITAGGAVAGCEVVFL